MIRHDNFWINSIEFNKRMSNSPNIFNKAHNSFISNVSFYGEMFIWFVIEIWYSLHQSLSQRLLNVSFRGSWSCSRCSLQYSVYKDLAFARKIFFGNLAFSEDLVSIKYWNSLFLKSIAFFGAPAPATLNLSLTSFPSISSYPVVSNSSHLPTNLIQIL